jgi:simple sugar transport system permease protein
VKLFAGTALELDLEDVLVPILAVGVAMIIGMLLVAASGFNPFQAYGALIQGAAGGTTPIARTLFSATPLILTGLAVAFAARAGLFNIGGTGQLVVGMIVGGWAAFNFGGLPQPLHVALELLLGIIAGGLWGAIAGFMKSVRGAHEVITTIMLNYVAIRLGQWLLDARTGLLHQHGNPDPQSPAFKASAGFPILWSPDPFTQVHLGLLLALLGALLTWFVIERTSLGYQIRAVGLNPDAAEYGGINVAKVTVIAMLIAGAFAGIAGVSIEIGDIHTHLSQSDFDSVAAGFTGIAVALLGRNTALGVVLSGLLFGALQAGAQQVQFSGGLPPGVGTKLIGVIQGLIILFVGADALFRGGSSWLLSRRGNAGGAGDDTPPPAGKAVL